MDFAILPPEINSGRMYAGPGSGPMLAAAAAWDGLAAELQAAGASYGSVIAGLTTGPWLGLASASMAAAAGPYVAWMRLPPRRPSRRPFRPKRRRPPMRWRFWRRSRRR